MIKKTISVALASVLAVSAVSSTAFAADVSERQAKKGSKTYQKKFKARCDNMTGVAFAGLYDSDEWEELYEDGDLVDEIKEACPNTENMKFRDRDVKKLFHFLYYYGADTGRTPSCG
jgi:hypothetical protein